MPSSMTLPRARAVRFVTALREGGSLPAIIENDREELVVAKFRGAGQGLAALVAEIVAGLLGQAVGLRVPALTLLDLDDDTLARTERDEEVGDLLRASRGTNVGLAFLPSAWMFDPAAKTELDPELAARIVAFDALVMNVDRTARNPNMLWCQDELWLIDHGAALLWHHGWDGSLERPDRAFPWVRDHVLLPMAGDLQAAGQAVAQRLDDQTVEAVAHAVPDDLLAVEDPAARRQAYAAFLRARRDAMNSIMQEAVDARRGL